MELAAETAEARAAGARPGAASGDEAEGGSDRDDAASAVTDEDGGASDGAGILADDVLFAAEGSRAEEPGAVAGDPLDDGEPVLSGGAAGSAGPAVEPPPLPPPLLAPPPDAARPKKVQKAAMSVLFVPGGKLVLYTGGKKDFLVAECCNLRHGRCVKTKTVEPPPERFAQSRKGQGRCVGYLAAWLRQGTADTPRAAHWDTTKEPTRAERLVARAEVEALDAAGDIDARVILGAEADAPPGEEVEPEVVP